ncbi:uncharacterized protein LOC128920096 [Zeugodacus cucurbitae]|uniref:uncharacterized protein LOC128920096 n=1 Tax=Zeugodacus cucurbitae TaxID=28588 RepID=UPI0023D9554E|nr:uncharacterized protein LOC128920096 [Zeugodacus cucurbitae]
MLNDEQETPAPEQQAPMRVDTLDQGKVKLPDFVEEHTDLWFWQVEAAFEAAGIVSDRKRYYTIIGQLPTRVMYKLADFRTNPPARNEMYENLKARIINEFADSTQTKLTKLLSDLSLGDRKPSQLLAEMRTRAAATPVTDELLKQLWLRNLPEQIRAILSADEHITLVNAATMADRIMEATKDSNSFIHAVQQSPVVNKQQTVNKHPQQSAGNEPASQAILEMQRQINALSRDLRDIKWPRRDNQRRPTPTRSGSRSREHHDTCWYHYKYGTSARKCRPPCKFDRTAGSTQEDPKN